MISKPTSKMASLQVIWILLCLNLDLELPSFDIGKPISKPCCYLPQFVAGPFPARCYILHTQTPSIRFSVIIQRQHWPKTPSIVSIHTCCLPYYINIKFLFSVSDGLDELINIEGKCPLFWYFFTYFTL